jgi:hypothetical protein
MNIEITQQQKFREQFELLVKDAPKKFKENWNDEIAFVNPTRSKIIPQFTHGLIDFLPIDLRNKYEILRNKYYTKSL